MGSRQLSLIKTPMRGTRTWTRRPNPKSRKRFCRPRKISRRRMDVINNGDTTGPCSSVADKLEALRNLIPAHDDNGEIKDDQLFKETANYIVFLQTQVLVLQKLVDFYGSGESQQAV